MSKDKQSTESTGPDWSEVNRLLLDLEKLVPKAHLERYDEFCAALDRLREEFARGRMMLRHTFQDRLDQIFVDFENTVFPAENGGTPELTTDIYDQVYGELQVYCSDDAMKAELETIQQLMVPRDMVNDRILGLRKEKEHILDFLRPDGKGHTPKP